MGTLSQKRELPIEWDILVSISDRCLKGRVAGFIETEIVKQLPASWTWRLYDNDTEYGTVEIARVGPGVSQVFFSGLGFSTGLTEEQRQVRNMHYQDVTEAYFFMLSQESIWKEDNLEVPETPKAAEEWKPWEYIPDVNQDRKIIKLWCKGMSAKEISESNEVFMDIDGIYNRISNLRQAHPEAKIPYEKDRKRMRY